MWKNVFVCVLYPIRPEFQISFEIGMPEVKVLIKYDPNLNPLYSTSNMRIASMCNGRRLLTLSDILWISRKWAIVSFFTIRSKPVSFISPYSRAFGISVSVFDRICFNSSYYEVIYPIYFII